MMLALGTFVFSLPTAAYQQLQRTTSWRHAASERVGARAAQQYVGPGEDSTELSGVLLPELTGANNSLDVLRDLADAGRPLALVAGTGEVLGSYVITRVQEGQSVFFSDGTPRRIEFSLSLLRTDTPADQPSGRA